MNEPDLFRVFYSWQSDLPARTNRTFIQRAIEKALAKIPRAVIITDVRGETGAPDITTTIFEKIDQADAFVCDVSCINNREDTGRPTPNPNVLVELGYAAAKLGWDRVVLVVNLAFGSHELLPFDIRNRSTVAYGCDEGADKAADSALLVSRLRSALEELHQRLAAAPSAAAKAVAGLDHIARYVVLREWEVQALADSNSDPAKVYIPLRLPPSENGRYGRYDWSTIREAYLRLLSAGIVKPVGTPEDESARYAWTDLGRAVARELAAEAAAAQV